MIFFVRIRTEENFIEKGSPRSSKGILPKLEEGLLLNPLPVFFKIFVVSAHCISIAADIVTKA
jgi:hypothetical protein